MRLSLWINITIYLLEYQISLFADDSLMATPIILSLLASCMRGTREDDTIMTDR